MKHFLLISTLAFFILSCQKDFQQTGDDYLATAKQSLKASLTATDFQALDFARAARSTVDSINFYALRVPFKGKVPKEDFVFVKTDQTGKVKTGKIIHLEGKISDEKIGDLKRKRWDGNIELSSLNRGNVVRSPIVDGYITAYHQSSNFRNASQEPQGNVLPEVIIVYTKTSKVEMSWSEMYLLQSMLGSGGGGGGGGSSSGGGYYGSFSGGNAGSGTTSTGDYTNSGGGGKDLYSKPGPSTDPVIYVDKETQDENSPIDIEKFINCFNAIPDAGATCSIEIYADIPVDSDPNKIFNVGTTSPGHTFLNIRKSNGTQSVSQNIGFYPKAGWKTMLTTAPIDGKFVDNGTHEFNCGFKLIITPAQLKSAIVAMQSLKNQKYDLDNYNCTDWALDVFNAAGGNLQIPLYDIPGNELSVGTRMPNGVYNKLREMKRNNDPRAANVNIGYLKGFAGNSTGACN